MAIESTPLQVDEHPHLLLRHFEDQCDYTLMFLDCQAMTSTASFETDVQNYTQLTNESVGLTLATIGFVFTLQLQRDETSVFDFRNTKGSPSLPFLSNNVRDLFFVFITLLIMTLVAVGITVFWYRLKSMLYRRRNKRLLIKQQQQYGRSSGHSNHYSTGPHSRSSTKIDSDPSVSSQHLIGPAATSFFSTISPAFDGLKDIETFIDDDPLPRDSIDDTATESNRIISSVRYWIVRSSWINLLPMVSVAYIERRCCFFVLVEWEVILESASECKAWEDFNSLQSFGKRERTESLSSTALMYKRSDFCTIHSWRVV